MNDIHPHWASDPDEETTVIPPPRGRQVPIAPRRSARGVRGAALLGILIACGIGYAFVQGIDGLSGQLQTGGSAGQPVRILITRSGLSPRSAAVQPGQTIVWRNEQDMPHILQSAWLKDDKGAPLYTRAIFPGSEERFVVSPTLPAGAYTYNSITAKEIAGEVVVGGPAAPVGSAPALGGTADIPLPGGGGGLNYGDPVSPPPAAPLTLTPSAKSDPYDTTPKPSQDALLPHNPYTVDRLGGKAATQKAKPSPPRPYSQPSTGPELWVVLAVTLPLSIVAMRRRRIA